MGKHSKFKAGAERNKLFPACRITEECEQRIENLFNQLPDTVKTKADFLEHIVMTWQAPHRQPDKDKKDLLNYPHKQLELIIPEEPVDKQAAKDLKLKKAIEKGPIVLTINANMRGLETEYTCYEYKILNAECNGVKYGRKAFNIEIGQRYKCKVLLHASKQQPGLVTLLVDTKRFKEIVIQKVKKKEARHALPSEPGTVKADSSDGMSKQYLRNLTDDGLIKQFNMYYDGCWGSDPKKKFAEHMMKAMLSGYDYCIKELRKRGLYSHVDVAVQRNKPKEQKAF